jgi:hypothetical protein
MGAPLVTTGVPPERTQRDERVARSNVRIALTLASIAAVFFVGVFAARMFGADGSGLTVLGFAIVVFLVIAIVRNVRSRK